MESRQVALLCTSLPVRDPIQLHGPNSPPLPSSNAMSNIMTLRGKASVYAGAALLRLALFVAFPALPDLLTGRVEVSTPMTSFKRCKQFCS